MSNTPPPPLNGYSKKPRAITCIALAFALLPLIIPLQVLAFSGGSWSLTWQVMQSGYFLQELLLSWSAAVAVFVVSRWSFIYFVLLSVYVLTTRVAYLAQHPYLDHPVSVLITAFWFCVVAYFLGSTLKTPYLHPQLRWWTRPARVSLRRNAVIAWRGRAIPVTVLNLSRGGAFVRVTPPGGQALPQRLGEPLHFRMQTVRACLPRKSSAGRQGGASRPRPFTARAEVVWVAAPTSPYRDGMGLQFVALSKRRSVLLQRYLRDATRR